MRWRRIMRPTWAERVVRPIGLFDPRAAVLFYIGITGNPQQRERTCGDLRRSNIDRVRDRIIEIRRGRVNLGCRRVRCGASGVTGGCGARRRPDSAHRGQPAIAPVADPKLGRVSFVHRP